VNAHNPQLPESVDVIVIGAGPSGSTAALVLGEAGRSVLFLERRTRPVSTSGNPS
jgi:flavin-dependent dehydrogenase